MTLHPQVSKMNYNQKRINQAENRIVDVRFTVLYDIFPILQDLQPGRGFSCVAQIGETTVLFDTGSDGAILLANMNRLGIEPRSIHMVLLSHNRCGHIGGLDEFLL